MSTAGTFSRTFPLFRRAKKDLLDSNMRELEREWFTQERHALSTHQSGRKMRNTKIEMKRLLGLYHLKSGLQMSSASSLSISLSPDGQRSMVIPGDPRNCLLVDGQP